jgi:hypothetical protein
VLSERRHALELHVGPVADDFGPVGPVGGGRRCAHELEVHGPVRVGEDQEAVLVRGRGVRHVVLEVLLAGLDAAGGGQGVGGRDEVLLRGDLRPGGDLHPLLREAEAHRHEEALVGVLVDEDIVGGIGADGVAPDLMGTHGRVLAHVEEHVVAGPGGAVGGLGDHLGEVLAGAQVPHLHPEALGPVVVGRVEQQVLAGGQVVGPHAEVVAVPGQHVHVEQHLLARHRFTGREVGRGLDVGPAEDGVLLALLGAAVEPALALVEGHREVGLLDAGLHLREQLRLERLGVGEGLLHVLVLGLEESQDLRVAAVVAAQPGPVVDALVAMGRDGGGSAGGDRGRGGHGWAA